MGVLNDKTKSRNIYELWGGKLSTYEQKICKLGKEYKEVFYTFDL